ncbi:hypothetical protein Sa4125_03080 [Aureimonas sp. SA4125]|nr:hypothetical protein Sa4125_03080 [Aureimonas sp. SA4125]
MEAAGAETLPAAGAGAPVTEDRRRSSRGPVIDPVYVAKAVWNSKLLIVATTIIGIVAAVSIAVSTPKQYTATTQILMDPRDLKVVANEITPNGLPSEGTLALIESQTSVIMSSNVLSRVIAMAGLESDPEFNGESTDGLAALLPAGLARVFGGSNAAQGGPEYQTLDRLRRALTVGRESKSFVINLSVETKDPDKSARLANIISDVFIAEQGRVQSDTARRATDALSSRLAELRQSVVTAEGAVEDYKSRNALIGVGGRLVDDEYITRINDQLARARGDITALRVKADSMRTASVEDVVRGTLPEELASEALVRLRQTYADLAQQEAVLGTKLGPRHPQRIASEGALVASRQAIAGELKRIVAAAQTELARAEATERDLTQQIDELKDKQVTTSGAFVKLRELEREVDASRAVYEAFLLRARETSEQESLNTANVRVISEATPPLLPSSMSRKTVVLAGGMLGFIAGVGIAGALAMQRLLRAVFADRRRKRTARWGDDSPRTPPGPTGRGPASDFAPGGSATTGASAAIPVVSAMPTFPDEALPPPAAASSASQAAVPLADDRPGMPDARSESPAVSAGYDAEPILPPGGAGEGGSFDDPRRVPMTGWTDGADTAAENAARSPGLSVPVTEGTATRIGDHGMGMGLTLAEVGRAASPEVRHRVSLRERVRAIAESDACQQEHRDAAVPALDPAVATLRDDIQTVKQAIADIRRRRGLSSEK